MTDQAALAESWMGRVLARTPSKLDILEPRSAQTCSQALASLEAGRQTWCWRAWVMHSRHMGPWPQAVTTFPWAASMQMGHSEASGATSLLYRCSLRASSNPAPATEPART